MSARRREVQLVRPCSAAAESVYELLSDLDSHLEWAGRRQRRVFRLLEIEGPPSPLVTGSVFHSTGTIPGSVRRWRDESVVTRAERPHSFVFRTEATAERGRARPMCATYRHSYDIRPHENGSVVTYTFTEESTQGGFLRLRLPVIGGLMWRYGLPMMMGRGFANLIRAAEQRAESVPTSPDVGESG